MNELVEIIADALKGREQTGSDYTAKVSRVEGSTAYVQITGSDIADTPVAMSISCKPGDMVRVRVANGKAWITGNDTAPPTDSREVEKKAADMSAYLHKMLQNTEGEYAKIEQTVRSITLEVGNKMDRDMGNRPSMIEIAQGLIKFLSNTIVIDSNNFKLDANGNATFSGTLDAAGGTFSGDLNAAGGTFTGKTDVYWHYGLYNEQIVKIGYSGNFDPVHINYPIMITDGPHTDYGSEDYYRQWCQMDRASLTFESDHTTSERSVCNVSSTGVSVQAFNSSGFIKGGYLDTNGAHTTSSDARLKEDIEDLDPEIAKRLRPVRFRFKGEDEIRYGFIAQEVQDIIPSAVNEGKEGYLNLNYSGLIAPILALVQQQEERITQLENRLKALEG